MNALRGAAIVAALAVSGTAAQAQMGGNFIGQPTAKDRAQQQQRQQGDPLPQRREPQFPLGANWVAVSLNGRPFSGERPSFSLDQQLRAKGYGGCNTFSATAYPLRQQSFAVGPLAITKRSCDKGRMSAEQSFFVALRTAQRWEMSGATLVLKGGNGELRFERVL